MNDTRNLSSNSLKVLRSRYLLRDSQGRIRETPSQLFRRVAVHVASTEKKWGGTHAAKVWEEHFFSMLCNLDFLPNSPTLMNAGIPGGQLSACFVLPVADNMKGIFDTLRQSALIQQSGGGTGFNFSSLRPANDPVKGTGGIASGPVSFMKVFDAATQCIRQGGKRRGANMGILDINHPDIEEFVGCKRQSGVLANFNISIGISDEFMQALERRDMWQLVHPNSGAIIRTIPASELWDLIVQAAAESGDPGMIFTDTINAHNPTPLLGRINATNPCGEVPLLPFEPCNLGSVNLNRFVVGAENERRIDFPELEKTIHKAIRFLDNIIEVNNYLFPEIREMALANRKIGLGVMGWADALIGLGIPYDSDEAVVEARKLMRFIRDTSRKASNELARERGAFPNQNRSIYADQEPLRNATTNSIAPTGSIALIAGCSCSIEPLFGIAFRRKNILQGETLAYVEPMLMAQLKKLKLDTPELLEEVMRTGSCASISKIPQEIRSLFKTAHEIAPARHLEHQLAFQEFTDNAVSKTINLPFSATAADVDAIYRGAWRGGAKGITIYRDRSKQAQVIYQGIGEDYTQSCKICTV